MFARLRLGFPMASTRKVLTRPSTITRRIIMQKARSHPVLRHRAPTGCRHVVSGSLSSPNRGSSHLSVALLFTIGCQVVLSLRRWTSWIQTAFHVSSPTRVSTKKHVAYKYGAVTLSGSAFLRILLAHVFRYVDPTTPLGRSRMV